MKATRNDYQDLLKITIENLFDNLSSFSITWDSDKEAFFVCLNNAEPVKLPLWEVKQKTNTIKNFVYYVKSKLKI